MSIADNQILDILIDICKRSKDPQVYMGGKIFERLREKKLKEEQEEAYDRAKKVI